MGGRHRQPIGVARIVSALPLRGSVAIVTATAAAACAVLTLVPAAFGTGERPHQLDAAAAPGPSAAEVTAAPSAPANTAGRAAPDRQLAVVTAPAGRSVHAAAPPVHRHDAPVSDASAVATAPTNAAPPSHAVEPVQAAPVSHGAQPSSAVPSHAPVAVDPPAAPRQPVGHQAPEPPPQQPDDDTHDGGGRHRHHDGDARHDGSHGDYGHDGGRHHWHHDHD